MDKVWIIGAGLGVMLAGGVAVAQAQNAPANPGPGAPPPPPGEMGGPGEMRGPHGGPHGGPWMMRAMMRRHESKAAHFRFRKGDAMVDIKCADDEPTKACVDAGSALLDKLQPK